MIATLAAQTGIAPLALRDCAVEDPVLLDELVEAAGRWTAELELEASLLEVTYALLRVQATLPGGRALPPLAVPRSRTLTREKRRVSVSELALLTGRTIEVRAEP